MNKDNVPYASLHESNLGKKTQYEFTYAPSLLFPIARSQNRNTLLNIEDVKFYGADVWYCYELSWLNDLGQAQFANARIIVPADSTNLVESKSLKLYLFSFNNTLFESSEALLLVIAQDLSKIAGGEVSIELIPLVQEVPIEAAIGYSLDKIVFEPVYQYDPLSLKVAGPSVKETLYSHLLRSNCPITNQPDWGTIFIGYQGSKIDRAGLLRYLVSLRIAMEFHEHCVERIFTDILKFCRPDSLCVEARYTRRGSLDINPIRSTDANYQYSEMKLFRQ